VSENARPPHRPVVMEVEVELPELLDRVEACDSLSKLGKHHLAHPEPLVADDTRSEVGLRVLQQHLGKGGDALPLEHLHVCTCAHMHT